MLKKSNISNVDLLAINNLILIPEGAKYIMLNFAIYGYETYLVGGCVRDMILKRVPSDWDICTSATPEQMINLINSLNEQEENKTKLKVIPTGLKHGTITIVVDGEPFEVTTFRCDGDYSDNRRPDNVTFTKSLIEDLKRRDFTMNAIAYNMLEGFIDPFNGIHDIENRIIRCVGSPYDRFNEDGLRIMRAIRFASQLNFMLHQDIIVAINDDDVINNLNNISSERINSELCKILSGNRQTIIMLYEKILCKIIPEFKQAIGFPQNNPYHVYSVSGHIENALKMDKSNDLIVRLALLFHDIGKPYCYQDDEDGTRHFRGHGKVSSEMTNEIMRRLKFDNDTREKVVELVHYHDATIEVGKKYIKRWLNILGEEQFRRLLEVRKADINAQSLLNLDERLNKIENITILLDEVLLENECFSLKDLDLNGNDLIQLGIPEGKLIGFILNKLLVLVIDDKVKNEKEELIKIINIMQSNQTLYKIN